jgi:predicted transcriptional regulator
MASARLTNELREALVASHGEPVPVVDDRTHKVYAIVDQQVLERAMKALKQQEDAAAIQAGIDDMEAGRLRPLAEVDAEIRDKHNIPRKT